MCGEAETAFSNTGFWTVRTAYGLSVPVDFLSPRTSLAAIPVPDYEWGGEQVGIIFDGNYEG